MTKPDFRLGGVEEVEQYRVGQQRKWKEPPNQRVEGHISDNQTTVTETKTEME